jgi:GntR family transcriptional regulator / MocR family aminotransferase
VPALDLFPLPLWARLTQRRMRSTPRQALDYGNPAGEPALRRAIARHVSDARGTFCTAEQVLIVTGAQRGLEVLFHALLDPGDVVAVEDPGFPGARAAVRAAGGRVCGAAVDGEGLVVETLDREAPGARAAYVTPSHQFPSGVPMTLPRRLALLQWARTARAWIVEDDYDSEYRYGARPIPCLHGLDRDGSVVYVGSFSKTLFPGLRLGFVIVPAHLQEALARIRCGADLHPPIFDQLVAADFLEEGHYERHLRRVRAACRERLEALVEAAGRHGGDQLRLRPVTTGLHAVADLAPDVDVRRLTREAADRGVEIMLLSDYAQAQGDVATPAVVLGFGAVDPGHIGIGVEYLVRAIDVSRNRRS